MKKLTSIIIVFVLIISAFNFSYSAGNPIEVFIDGTKLNLSPEPTIQDGNLYVPMNALCSALGADIMNSKNGLNDVYTIIRIKTNRVLVIESGLRTVKVNGNPVDLKFDPILIGSIEDQKFIFVSLEFAVEKLGGEVQWNKETNKVNITSIKPITIKDSNLDSEIHSQFKIPAGNLYIGDVKSIETLILNNKNIADIDGLQYFESLTNLDLSNNQIKDIMPLKNLKNLSVLLLKGNPVYDFSPTVLYYDKLIKDFSITIQFKDKKLEEAVAAAAGKKVSELKQSDLSVIKVLDLSGKGISDLEGIQYLINLNELDLSDNSIQSIAPIENLIYLKKLSLSSNKISNISPMKYLTELEFADLDENNISDISPLSNCVNLKQLSISGNNIADAGALERLVKMEILDLSENDITGIKGLDKLVGLKELYLNMNLITDISILGSLANLEVLDLTENDIAKLSGIEKLTKLKALYLSSNNISDVSQLEKSTGIQVLDLTGNNISKIDSLGKLVNLTTLYLNGNNISDYSPLKACVKLTDKDYDGSTSNPDGSIVQRFYIGKYTYYVNDKEKKMDTTPVIKGGRTFLPIRYVSETIGATVGWDEKEKKVTVTLGSNNIALWINKDVAMVNGSLKKLDAAPFILSGRTVLPIRFVSENLGVTVKWDQAKQEVTLLSAANTKN